MQVELVCLSRAEGESIIEFLRTSTIFQVGFQGRTVEKSTDRLSSKRTSWKGGLSAAFFVEEVIRNNAARFNWLPIL